VEEICNGCGICENVCPLEGKPGIEIFAVKNRRPIEISVKDTQNLPPAKKDNTNYGY
jgi:ferredoxin